MAEKSQRPPIAEKFLAVTNAINRHPGQPLPQFSPRFFTVAVTGDRVVYLKADEDGLVTFTSPEGIIAAILKYVHRNLTGDTDCATWVAKTAEAAFKFWANYTRPLEMPPSWRWIDEDGLTFHRVPFRPHWGADIHDCPLFFEMMQRTTNRDAVMAWIGSIFDPASDLQQYVWIYGHGNDGKGSLARFLTKVLAGACAWEQPPSQGDKFWTSGLLGKRLVVYGDCNQAGWVTSGPFKSMTGGDPVRIEQKFGASFTEKLTAKHLFLSNKRPTIDGDKADQRRIIYAEMSGINEDADPAYEDRLWEEGAHFLGACVWAYQKLNGKRIPVVADGAEALASMKEEELAYAAERYFNFSPTLSISPNDFHEQCRAIGYGANQQQRRLFDYLNREYGVKKMRRGTTQREWIYVGLTTKGMLREEREKTRLT